jgi:alkylation response protein AidB-like acyl-CoA dehydrogenase
VNSDLFESEHVDFGETVRGFVTRHVAPKLGEWDQEKLIDRETWEEAGRWGLLGLAVPEEHGGPGVSDYRFRTILQFEIARVGAASLQSGFSTNDDIVLRYLLRHANEDQKQRWLPGFVTGQTIAAIAMSEPCAGSDLRSIQSRLRPDGDLAVVFVRTTSDRDGGFSLVVVEDGMRGFERGRKLEKIGLHAQDTAELFFDDVHISAGNVLGEIGQGFAYLMQSLPLERLGIAIAAQAGAEAALQWTLDYVRERNAFGHRIADFQSLSFKLAELTTAVEVCRAYVDRCVRAWNAGTLNAVDAAKAKYWATEVQGSVVDGCLQMFGGYGYMTEYPIARAFVDARIQRIYGGTNEVMKEIIQRELLGQAPSATQSR